MNKKIKKECVKAGACVGMPTVVCIAKGGAIGIATSGVAISVPLWGVGAVVGFAGYGAYKFGESVLKKKKGNNY